MLDTYRRVETPEGVELGLRVAGPAPRALAWLLDLTLRSIVYFAASIPLQLLGGLGLGLFSLLVFAGEWVYPVLFEALWSGQTPGKRLLGLQVLHDDGTPVSISAALVRNLVRWADFLPAMYGIGLTSVLLSRDFKRLGDHAAGTVVCHLDPRRRKEQVPEHPPRAPSVPLSAAESRAVVAWAGRCSRLSAERARELSDLLQPLTGARGKEGQERLLGIANWAMGRR